MSVPGLFRSVFPVLVGRKSGLRRTSRLPCHAAEVSAIVPTRHSRFRHLTTAPQYRAGTCSAKDTSPPPDRAWQSEAPYSTDSNNAEPETARPPPAPQTFPNLRLRGRTEHMVRAIRTALTAIRPSVPVCSDRIAPRQAPFPGLVPTHSTHKPRNRKVQATPPATESPLESAAESSFTRARRREELHIPARKSPECNASSVYAPAAARPGRDGGGGERNIPFAASLKLQPTVPQGTPCQGNQTAVSIRRNVTTVR